MNRIIEGMNGYIEKWIEIIEGMNNTNTYKLAFGRAIVENACIGRYSLSNDLAVIEFKDIAECMVQYYWNQAFYFNLKQQPGDKVPLIYQRVKILIDEYKRLANTNIPCWANEGLDIIKTKNFALYSRALSECANILTHDVSYRFLNINGRSVDIYRCDLKLKMLFFRLEDLSDIKEYSHILIKLLNYKWSLLLEKYNCAPELLNKINDAAALNIPRNSLSKYKNFLLKNEFHDNTPLDFYSEKPLLNNDISVDHVIPWSFMYRDDIWNLVLTDRKTNSSKSNSVINEHLISRLQYRNKKLCSALPEGKEKEELKMAITENLVKRFYLLFIAS